MAGAVRESIVPLKHSDNTWAVQQRIELAPGDMALRELVQNAIENALLLPRQSDRNVRLRGIEWRCTPQDEPVPKLAIWNRGPGMSADKLLAVLDLAASGDEKRQGSDANFGVGAKTAGLKASPEGLRYRTCHGGRVYEAVIALRKGIYGKIKKQIGIGWEEVWDATEACRKEGYPLDYDWTEVLLMGQSRVHDTIRGLLLDESADKEWLSQRITQRFYDLSAVHLLREASATKTADHGRRLQGLKAIPVQQDELVPATVRGQRIDIRYGLTRERTGGGPEGKSGYTAHACLVFANECFDYHESLPWRRVAPRFGIPHGQGRVFVHVLLPEKYPVVFDQYRKNIEDLDRKRIVRLEEFQEAIFDHRPQWLIDFIASQAPAQLEMSDTLKRRLRELAEYLKWYRDMYKHDETGTEMANFSDGTDTEADGRGEHTDSVGEQDDSGLKPASDHRNRRGQFPEYVWVNGGTSQQRGEMPQRCARYDRQMHKIRLNIQYEGIERAIEMIVAEFQHAHDQAALRVDATNFVKEEIEFSAIKHVMLGLVHESEMHWSRANVEDALSCEALSVPLSDYRSIAASVRPRIAQKYGKSH